MANPGVKVQKAKLYKMVSYKGVTAGAKKYTPLTAAAHLSVVEKNVGKGLGTVAAGLNSLGATLNTISLNSQNMLESWRNSIRSQISDNKAIAKREALLDKAREKREKAKDDAEALRRKKAERDESEEGAEKTPFLKKIGKAFKQSIKGGIQGLFGGLLRMLRWIIPIILGYHIFDWISKNPDKVEKLFKGLAAFGKFIFNVTGFLVGSSLDGLVKFLENPLSFKGMLGALQFILSAAPLFAAFAFLKSPVATVKALAWVVGTLGKGIMNMFKQGKLASKFRTFSTGKFGKLFNAAAVGGTAAFTASLDPENSGMEIAGTGIGAGVGQAAGAAIGAATGIPGAGIVGGMIGSAAGAPIGKAIGGLLEPIVEPVQKWFSQIGKIFNNVIADIKKPIGQFFEVLGKFFNQILDAVAPHIPMISKILGIGFKVIFWPLFLGIKALTTVLKFFTGGGGNKSNNTATWKETVPVGGSTSRKKVVTHTVDTTRDFTNDPDDSHPGSPFVESAKEKKFRDLQKKYGLHSLEDMTKIGQYPDAAAAMQAYNEEKQDYNRKKKDYDDMIRMTNDEWKEKKIAEDKARVEGERNKERQKRLNADDSPGTITPGGKANRRKRRGRAGGGWIDGPMSGYPVSLTGRGVDFIGHGREWVGMKEGGKAFVVPFDTPATRQNKGLTRKRLTQAHAGGFGMPKYAEGGEFDMKSYQAGMKTTKNIDIEDESGKKQAYKIEFTHDGYNVNILGALKKTHGGVFGAWQGFAPVDPRSDEYKMLIQHANTKERIARKAQFKSGTSVRNRKVDPSKIASIASDPKIQEWYEASLPKKEQKKLAAEKAASPEEQLKKALQAFASAMGDVGAGLEEAKQKENQAKFEKQQAAMNASQANLTVTEDAAAVVTAAGGESADPIVIPGRDHLDADEYLQPKFGMVAEFTTKPVELM